MPVKLRTRPRQKKRKAGSSMPGGSVRRKRKAGSSMPGGGVRRKKAGSKKAGGYVPGKLLAKLTIGRMIKALKQHWRK